ncbi:MAG: GtrA family protein [Acidiferrobacterales bacterium]
MVWVPLRHSKTAKQFITFAGVGAIGTAVHYMTLISLVETINVKPVYATTVGFIVGALINYILNYIYTFQSNKAHVEAVTKFLTVAAIGAVVNSSIMFLGQSVLQFNYILVQIIATGIVLLQNFSLNKWWTFARSKYEA